MKSISQSINQSVNQPTNQNIVEINRKHKNAFLLRNKFKIKIKNFKETSQAAL